MTDTPPNAEPQIAAEGAELDLQSLLAEAEKRATEYKDGWQRERAEFVNFRKRADKEREEVYQTATVEAMRKFLPIIDDFDRALQNISAEQQQDEVIKGLIMIHRKFNGLVESAGIKVIDPLGALFNPAYHEAIGEDATSSVPSGHVSTVLQKGYSFGERVIRPAIVRVAS
jgi:molecular chaperone GrpE